VQEAHTGDLLSELRDYQGTASLGLRTDKTRDLGRQVFVWDLDLLAPSGEYVDGQ
jgi:hypothetical protein